MNLDEMRRIFDASPPPSAVDIDAALRAGRRGRRRLSLAVAASVATVLAAAGIACAAIEPSSPQRAATAANMVAIQPAADAGVPVASASELSGVWQTVQLDGKDVSEVRDRNGDPLFVRFGEHDEPWWSANDGCNQHDGWLTSTADGRFAAPGFGTWAVCPDHDEYPQNPEAIASAQEARIFGAEDEPRHLMLVGDGRILALYVYQPDADLGSRGQR